jgi:hypothetical protein
MHLKINNLQTSKLWEPIILDKDYSYIIVTTWDATRVEMQIKNYNLWTLLHCLLNVKWFCNPSPSAPQATKFNEIGFEINKICPLELKGSLFDLN